MNTKTTDIWQGRIRSVIRMAILLLVFGSVQPSFGLVWIWDSTNLDWTTTLTDGTPIDTTHAKNAIDPQVAVDSNGNTYVVFKQDDTVGTGIGRIYLSRYDDSGEVRIWDNDTSSWTPTLSDGDPIDTGILGRSAQDPQLAIDTSDRVYVVFAQSDGVRDRIYLSRFNGTDVRIYSAGIWTTNFAVGTPIDANTGNPARSPRLAIDSTNQVYVTFYQNNGAQNHIYLCRFNGLDVRIWDNDTHNWTTVFANGDPIDTTLAMEADSPKIVIDSRNNVYVAYRQNDGAFFNIYLSRFSIVDGVQIWNTGAHEWTTTLTDGNPIGLSGASGDALGPDLTIDANNHVYIAYAQQKSGVFRIFFSRYNAAVAQIWSGIWRSDTFAFAQPIDTGNTQADIPRLIADSNNNIFVVFEQSVGGLNRIHLSQWNGTAVQIWDTDVPGWSSTLGDGDPIDAATGQGASLPEMTIDTMDRVYIAFQQNDGGIARVYLSRYDTVITPLSPVVAIWDQNGQTWTTTFTNGDPIDAETGADALHPQLATNSVDEVFITYYQNNGSENHIYLSGYENSGVPPTTPTPPPSDDSGTSCFLSSMGFSGIFSQ